MKVIKRTSLLVNLTAGYRYGRKTIKLRYGRSNYTSFDLGTGTAYVAPDTLDGALLLGVSVIRGNAGEFQTDVYMKHTYMP